ncbi:MAG: hypothetical protein KH409_06110, partial [Clostridium sp.]|nr:hypothetical protein [Clostridium sp.]
KLGVQCRTPSRSDRFNGVTGGAGGPKGRNRNLPWPPCKKVIKKLAVLFYSLRPLVPLAATSLDREAFWRYPNSYVKPPSPREVAMNVSELTEGV